MYRCLNGPPSPVCGPALWQHYAKAYARPQTVLAAQEWTRHPNGQPEAQQQSGRLEELLGHHIPAGAANPLLPTVVDRPQQLLLPVIAHAAAHGSCFP